MARTSQHAFDYSFIAENDMAEAYVVVVQGTDQDEVDLPAAVTDTPLGVIQDTADEDQSVPVRLSGVTKVVANGAFSRNDQLVIAATTGRVDTVTGLDSSFDGGTATAQQPIGIALTAASAAGEIAEMLIRPLYYPWG